MQNCACGSNKGRIDFSVFNLVEGFRGGERLCSFLIIGPIINGYGVVRMKNGAVRGITGSVIVGLRLMAWMGLLFVGVLLVVFAIPLDLAFLEVL